MSKRRVVVTGLGVVSPVGNTVEASWNSILKGKSGVGPITRFDASSYATRIAAEVKDFDPSLSLSKKEARKLDLFVQFAVEASRQALDDSGIEVNECNADRIGVAIGSGIGGMYEIERNHSLLLDHGPRCVSPFFIPGSIINMAPGYVSINYGLKGPNIAIVTACTTGLHNIGEAARMIAYGDADMMIAGGSEMATVPLGVSGFAAVRALSKRNHEPEKASRPWDKARDGFVLGEGAASLFLEEYEHAKARGATMYAELAGYGVSGDAYHMTAPDKEARGFCKAMQNALNDADIPLESISYINAHGTSTPTGDPLELSAIKKVFGDHAYQLAVSSTKSMTGHTLGAAGALEIVFSILALRDNVAPPTINLDDPDEDCDLHLVPKQSQPMKMEAVMSNSFGFGGTNGTIILTRV